MLINNLSPCPCGSDKTFNDCCGQFINESQSPDSPEQLMRSRYSAYVLKNEGYLLKSWHVSTRTDSLDLSDDSTQWKKLKIISAFKDKVHFVAYFTQDTLNKDKIYALTEISNFVNEKGWEYLDGENVKTVQLTKNMLCPCQSRKKYKRCCATEI